MSDKYVPTTDNVRDYYGTSTDDPADGLADFDAWFQPYADALAAVQRMRDLSEQDIANNLGMTDGAWIRTPKGGKHWKMAEGIHQLIYHILEGEV